MLTDFGSDMTMRLPAAGLPGQHLCILPESNGPTMPEVIILIINQRTNSYFWHISDS
jgi:hypothetical protein